MSFSGKHLKDRYLDQKGTQPGSAVIQLPAELEPRASRLPLRYKQTQEETSSWRNPPLSMRSFSSSCLPRGVL